MMRDLINISLPRYGTRMLVAGDHFEAKRKDARVLTALKRARYVDESDEAAPPAAPAAPVAPPARHQSQPAAKGDTPVAAAADDLSALRAKYQAVLGKRPFNGWSADELKAKIAAGPDQG